MANSGTQSSGGGGSAPAPARIGKFPKHVIWEKLPTHVRAPVAPTGDIELNVTQLFEVARQNAGRIPLPWEMVAGQADDCLAAGVPANRMNWDQQVILSIGTLVQYVPQEALPTGGRMEAARVSGAKFDLSKPMELPRLTATESAPANGRKPAANGKGQGAPQPVPTQMSAEAEYLSRLGAVLPLKVSRLVYANEPIRLVELPRYMTLGLSPIMGAAICDGNGELIAKHIDPQFNAMRFVAWMPRITLDVHDSYATAEGTRPRWPIQYVVGMSDTWAYLTTQAGDMLIVVLMKDVWSAPKSLWRRLQRIAAEVAKLQAVRR